MLKVAVPVFGCWPAASQAKGDLAATAIGERSIVQSEELAVLDIESTGFSRDDRVCEIAIINLDIDTLTPIDEFSSLVNPKQDTGPAWVHGITNEMVAAAPTFPQLQEEIASRLDGRVLVGHNLPFDGRFLKQEWVRCGAHFYPGDGFCTLSMTREKLVHAAKRHGLATNNMHSALGDARVTAELFALLDGRRAWTQPAVVKLGLPPTQRPPLPRPDTSGVEVSTLAGLISEAVFPPVEENVLAYLDKLGGVLEDLVLTDEEARELEHLRRTLGLSEAEAFSAHQEYLQAVIEAAEADHIITPAEHRVLTAVAELLDCEAADVPEASSSEHLVIRETRVCATGDASDADGKPMTQEEFRSRCHAKGIVHVSSVSGKCDILVAEYLHIKSAKVEKARELGIPVMSYEDFAGQYGI